MPAITKTWVFLSDAEGLADAGSSSNITFQWQSADGSPANGCVEFVQGAGLASLETEYGRKSVGDTWQTWGVPVGSTITAVQITNWKARHPGGLPGVGTDNLSSRLINDSGGQIALLLNAIDYSAFSDTWTAKAAGPTTSGLSIASNTGVRLELQVDASDANFTLRLDTIELTITYTTALITPSTGSVAVVGAFPPLDQRVAPNAGLLILTGAIPNIPITLLPRTGRLTISGKVPALLPQIITPVAGSLSAIGQPVPGLNSVTLTPGTATTAIVGSQPIIAGMDRVIVPGIGSLSFQGQQPLTGTPSVPNAQFYDFPNWPVMRRDVYNNIVACAFCVPATKDGIHYPFWDLYVAITRRPLNDLGAAGRWIVTKIEPTLDKTNVGLCFLPNGWLFLSYDLPDGTGGYKAVRRLNAQQGDPAGWSAAVDWTGHGCDVPEQAARFVAVHAYDTLYKVRSNWIDQGSTSTDYGTIYISQLKSTDGTDWTTETLLIDASPTGDSRENWTVAAAEAWLDMVYYGNEFDLLYEATINLNLNQGTSVKFANPRTSAIRPHVLIPDGGATRMLFLSDSIGSNINRIYGASLGVDNVLWTLATGHAFIDGNDRPVGPAIARDRSRARKQATVAVFPVHTALMEYIDPLISIYGVLGLLQTICTIGAIPMVMSVEDYSGNIRAIVSLDGGATWLTA